MALAYSYKRLVSTAAAVASGLCLSLPADAHAIWFAQRAKQTALVYGVGADDLDAVSRLPKITSVKALDEAGLPVDATLKAAGIVPVVDSDEPFAVVAAAMDYGLWTKDAAGTWHNKGKDEVAGPVTVSEHNWKYGVYLKTLPTKPVPLIEGQTLQIVPVLPIAVDKGKPLTVRAMYMGKPVAGVKIMSDYVNDPDETPVTTGADGTATVTLRNQGLNVIVGILVVGSDEPARYNQMEHRASLAFTLPHLPE
ncbi:DUF4198 domain-containing protein [Novosphingobium colocasiae]|uniref:DUF4198 domain-containing protein n=1 Tax=Novosphingobium colocasiae TaxID=1256513 RepID=A0A918PGX4_9SPHN|nr:DUF4198 domain-containing protein [Novosphingobium colocasiae]GGZ07962.1 hypothetical protein GCM10011614_23640 [Novosphingobium colocasiae]